jgi:NADPH:quinone reductase-like Zn-dependent oxidoreductase
MKASVLHEYGPPSNLKYEDFPDPKPGPGEVLVRVHAAGVNPIDWKIRSGAMAKMYPTSFPAVLGYDIAGVVRETGEGVQGFAAGDQVFGRTSGAYAELAVIKAAELARVPAGLELTTAGGLGVVTTTAHQLIYEAVNVQPGQTLLLTGALGSVGRIALYAAKEAGAKVIAGVRKKHVEEALALGATAAIDIDDAVQVLVGAAVLVDLADGVHHRGVVLVAELAADLRQAGFGHLLGQVHGDLPRHHDVARVVLLLQLG